MVIWWLKKFFCLKGKGSFYGNSMAEDIFCLKGRGPLYGNSMVEDIFSCER